MNILSKLSRVALAALLVSTALPAAADAQFGGLGGAVDKLKKVKKIRERVPALPEIGVAGVNGGGSTSAGSGPAGPAAVQAPPAGASAKVIGPYRYGSVNDIASWNGKLYVAAGSDGGIVELDPGKGQSRLFSRKGWKTDNFYDSGVYELAAGPEGLFALRGKSLFKMDGAGGASLISDGWGYVKGMALLGGKLYVIDGETLFVRDLGGTGGARQLAEDWYNCLDLETVGGKLVALCQDRLWVVQPNGSRKQLGARDYSDPTGIADLNGQVHLVASTFHGYEAAANDRHEASIYAVDWSGKATKISPLPKPWDIHEKPHDVASLNGALFMPRAHQGGYGDDREVVVMKF